MTTTWRKVAVLLVVVIAILQIIHMTLLSQLEAKKSRHSQNEARVHKLIIDQTYRESKIWEDRSHMFNVIKQSSVLDSSGEYRIINFLITADSLHSQTHSRHDVSLVVHSTVNHLHYLNIISSRWLGPISHTIFAYAHDIPLAVDTVLHLRHCYPEIRYNTTFHLVFPLNNPSSTSVPSELFTLQSCDMLLEEIRNLALVKNYAHNVLYPNNLLRNVGRRHSNADFVFVTDVDMIPSHNLHDQFFEYAKENKLFQNSNKDDKTVYVIPAFEIKEMSTVPLNKSSLLKLIEEKEARPFYYELCWKCQKHTDYESWKKEAATEKMNIAFEVLWKDAWEPFYIGRNTIPYYDERFRQYGFNRISQVCELHMAGYKFAVLNNGFVIHHGWKITTSFHKSKEAELQKNRQLFRHFKQELKEKYPESSRRCY